MTTTAVSALFLDIIPDYGFQNTRRIVYWISCAPSLPIVWGNTERDSDRRCNSANGEKMTVAEQIRLFEEVRTESIGTHKGESARVCRRRRPVKEIDIFFDDMDNREPEVRRSEE